MGISLEFSVTSLNQWTLDFNGNTARTLQSLREAKESGAKYRLGCELEITGRGCEDHFFENDTYAHSWECIGQILRATLTDPTCQDIVCDIGAPILFQTPLSPCNSRYNCRVIILNGQILLIRPKLFLANQGLYQESRWFTPWSSPWRLEEYQLPEAISRISGQTVAPFGCTLLRFLCGTVVGMESFDELRTTGDGFVRPHLTYSEAGAHIIFNAGASYHELEKFSVELELIIGASQRGNMIYAYSNLLGCDGSRSLYDGSAVVADRGKTIYIGARFTLGTVHTTNVVVERGLKAVLTSSQAECWIDVDFMISHENLVPSSITLSPIYPLEEEIALASALWLWDNLRRSRAGGFFLCLSGGLDSSSVAYLAFTMCKRLYEEVRRNREDGGGNRDVVEELRRVVGAEDFEPQTPGDICLRLLTTCYLPVAANSSPASRARAAKLAAALGCRHLEVDITETVRAFVEAATQALGRAEGPRFAVQGGSRREDAALQNVQARSRLVAAYLVAQLVPAPSAPPLLLLGSANLDEALCGYLTKYDCSSADLNPIGSVSKEHLRRFLRRFAETSRDADAEGLAAALTEVLEAQPTAELTPLGAGGELRQTDEADIGLTYAELSRLGALRKREALGPVGAFRRLLDDSGATSKTEASVIADKVKLFFRRYSANRHKTAVLTPSPHMESYSAEDHRFDLRPLIYRDDWAHQFEQIDRIVESLTD